MTNDAAPPKLTSLWKRPIVLRYLLIALMAEIGYAVLNISTMPVYLRFDRHLGEGAVGLVITAFLLSEAIFKSPMGHLADKYGRRLPMTFGPLLTVGTSLLSLIVPRNAGSWEVVAFVVLRVFDGIGAAMLWPAAFGAMGDAVEDGERQQAMSLLNVCYLLGVALALPVGGIVNDLSHVKWASLLLSTGLFAAVAAVAWRFVPSVNQSHATEKAAHGGEAGVKDLLKSAKQIPAYLFIAVITFAGIGFPMAIIKIFAQEQFQMSETSFGALVFPAAILMAAFSVPMSKFGERVGRARAVHLGMGACAIGLIVISLGAFFAVLRTPLALALGGIPVGFGFLLAIPAWMASVSDVDPAKRSAYLGAVMTAQGVGAIIGAPIGSACYQGLQKYGEDFGRYSPFLGCAACVTIAWLVGLKILRDPR